MPCRGVENSRSEDISFGKTGDIPVPGDFNGDGAIELAVYRPSEKAWYVRDSVGEIRREKWSVENGVPFAGDFDGDGKDDFAFYRPDSNEHYYIRFSVFQGGATASVPTKPPTVAAITWGASSAPPVEVALRAHQCS